MEEPELNLHPAVVKFLPQMIHRATRKSKRQVMMSTHSPELLSDVGIAADETLLLSPDQNGTRVNLANDDETIRTLLASGQPMAEAALPRTAPRNPEQLVLFGE